MSAPLSASAQSILQYFLLHTPPGEAEHVIADLKVLTNDASLLDEHALQPVLRTYNTGQLAHCTTDQSATILLTPYNQYTVPQNSTQNADQHTSTEQQYDQYIDPNSKHVYTVNHVDRTATVTEHTYHPMDAHLDGLRAAVQKQLEQYITDYYSVKKVVGCVYALHSELVICISGQNTNLANYWTGSWNSVYKYNTINQQLSGTINIQVHYFEDGNVQLHNTHTMQSVAVDSGSDESALSAAVLQQIQAFESAYQQSLSDMYENMNEITFKQMRRFLPITRTKFQWANLANDTSLYDIMKQSSTVDK